jgi:hypothetical protein
MRLVQCFYCGAPGDWAMFDTEMEYRMGDSSEVRTVQVSICDVDIERNGVPPKVRTEMRRAQ